MDSVQSAKSEQKPLTSQTPSVQPASSQTVHGSPHERSAHGSVTVAPPSEVVKSPVEPPLPEDAPPRALAPPKADAPPVVSVPSLVKTTFAPHRKDRRKEPRQGRRACGYYLTHARMFVAPSTSTVPRRH